MEKYASAALIDDWLKEKSMDRKLPNTDQIASIFYKAARDFRIKRLGIKDFSKICDNLLFGVYLAHLSPNSRLDSRVETALWKFADPSASEVGKDGCLKKKLHDKYLGFVNKKFGTSKSKWFIKLMERYSAPSVVRLWFDERKKPSVKEISNIFYKSARDFKVGKIGLITFSSICMELYFDAYLSDRKKFPSGLTIQNKNGKVRAEVVKVTRTNGKFVATRLKLPPLKSDLDPRVVRALGAFSDSYGNEADRYWRLKKEFHEKYLGFVR